MALAAALFTASTGALTFGDVKSNYGDSTSGTEKAPNFLDPAAQPLAVILIQDSLS